MDQRKCAYFILLFIAYCESQIRYYSIALSMLPYTICKSLDVTHTFDITSADFFFSTHFTIHIQQRNNKQYTTFYWPHSMCSLDLDRIVLLHSDGIFFPHDCMEWKIVLALYFCCCFVTTVWKKNSKYDWNTDVKICICNKNDVCCLDWLRFLYIVKTFNISISDCTHFSHLPDNLNGWMEK